MSFTNQPIMFSTYCVGAIIEKEIGKKHVLLQRRYKGSDSVESGLIEVPCAKVRIGDSAFDVIRRKVKKETGLCVENIYGEDETEIVSSNGYKVINYTPFYTSQNLNSNYSIAIDFFICNSSGIHCKTTDESYDIGWVSVDKIKKMLEAAPEAFYPMVVYPLKKYCELHL